MIKIVDQDQVISGNKYQVYVNSAMIVTYNGSIRNTYFWQNNSGVIAIEAKYNNGDIVDFSGSLTLESYVWRYYEILDQQVEDALLNS